MSNVIVIGAGMVGSAMAIDMTKKYNVTLTDLNGETLKKVQAKCTDLQVQELDVCDKNALSEAIRPYDLVICAVPGFLGFETLKTIIETGKNVVDISFFSENSLDLDALAKEHGVTAIVDCGVAPGMDNILLGYHNEKMKVESFECLVGVSLKLQLLLRCHANSNRGTGGSTYCDHLLRGQELASPVAKLVRSLRGLSNGCWATITCQ